ncbi:MAG: hypothetical protein H7222_09925 [Methylotenera sp.]|nr:hypothetical protein [Oligoflexia bacterium]
MKNSTPRGELVKEIQTDARHDLDAQSEGFLNLLSQEQLVRTHKVPGVKSVLVVLSSRGMVFDTESLRQKVLLTYPEAKVYFLTTIGKAIGTPVPKQVDLLIDFTGPGQRQGWFYARKLRSMARVAIGRNAGLFRAKIYDQCFDDKAKLKDLPRDLLGRERLVQKQVLAMAGIPMAQHGDLTPDTGKTIALDLPSLKRT